MKFRNFAFLCIILSVPVALLPAAKVPDRYIVELSTDAVVQHLIRQNITPRRGQLQTGEAAVHRGRIRTEQQSIRQRLDPEAVVLGSVDTVANALLVQIPDAKAAALASLAGVRRVFPVRSVHMVLDRAVAVNKVVEAWNQIGLETAGAGVKIAIIDTGIDSAQAGLDDPSLPPLESFPKVNFSSDTAYTNNKIIVARSYVGMLSVRDPDRSASDRVGHGTALATIAAGRRSAGPLASIMGVAPKAYLGNYKVFGSPGYNDGTTEDIILKAIDDAVADGMDIINLSMGSDLAPRLTDDLEVQAVEQATRAGVIVVVAAGNNGAAPATISSPATAPSAIAVGASHNDRTFAASVQVEGLPALLSVLSNGTTPAAPVSGPFSDIASLDGTGEACASLPSGTLTGHIALILRGNCTFESKLNNVQQAGAEAAVVYAREAAPAPFSMAVGAATLPAQMVGFSDGVLLKQRIDADPSLSGTLQFELRAIAIDPNRLASFSAAGPNVDAGIKPDLVAVGSDVYTATQKLDANGEMYDSTGYILVDGTSFSTPIVAGAVALLKSSRPGLTVDQYRSLLINTASPINSFRGIPAKIQQAGTGALNAWAAVTTTAASYPAALNFGAGGPAPRINRTLTITNLAASTETFGLSIATGDTVTPTLATNTIQLAGGSSMDVPVQLQRNGLAAGAHEGFVRVIAATTGTEIRIPYWYAVKSDVAAGVTILENSTGGRRGSLIRDAVLFKIADAAGLPITTLQPQISAISGGGSVQSILSYDTEVPGLYSASLRLGETAGANVFRIQAGDAIAEVSIIGQ